MADTDAKHARKRATPAAAARNREAAQAARKPARRKRATRTITPGGRTMNPRPASERREVTPRQVAAAPGNAAATVTQRSSYSARHMLTAELILAVIVVAIRAVADYEPQADGTIKGKIGHPKGQYGPLPILAGLIVSFFLLSFLAASGGTKAKLAVIAGGTIDVALLLKSTAELQKVSDVFGTFGKAKVPPGNWQTSGDIAGQPISGNLPAGGTVSPGNLNPKGNKKNPSVQPPPGSIPVPPGGCPSGYLEEGDPTTGAKWCAKISG